MREVVALPADRDTDTLAAPASVRRETAENHQHLRQAGGVDQHGVEDMSSVKATRALCVPRPHARAEARRYSRDARRCRGGRRTTENRQAIEGRGGWRSNGALVGKVVASKRAPAPWGGLGIRRSYASELPRSGGTIRLLQIPEIDGSSLHSRSAAL